MKHGLLIAIALPALLPSVALAQTPRDNEISAIRAEIVRLTERLNKLEADDDATAKPAAAVATPSSADAAHVQAVHTIPDVLTGDSQLALAPADVAALQSRTVTGATLDRALLPDGAAFELSATSDTSSVAIKVARSQSDVLGEFGVYTTLALTASAPLSSGNRFSDIGTLDGFIGGSKLRFQYSRYERRITDPDLHPAYEALVETTKAACRARLGTTAKECASDIISTQFVKDYAPELESALIAMTRMTPGPNPKVDWSARAYGLELSVGYKKFNFIEAGPARKGESSRVPLSGRVFLSYLPDVRRNSVTGTVEYQRTFKDASAGALCPVGPTGSELQCLTGPIGGPRRNEKLLLSGEYRHKFVFSEYSIIPTIGVSLLGTYDALNDDFGIDVPIYLVNDPKNGLTGGVRFGYTTAEKDFVAGVFVGTAFSLR